MVYGCNIGATFHNGTNIQIPEVDVHSIYTQDTGAIDIRYEYAIFTNTTQNVTLAIACPFWIFDTTNISIALNSSQVNYGTLPWADLGWNSSEYDEFNLDEYWFSNAHYAVLDLSLILNTTSIIEFKIQDEARNVDFFDLRHFVGSIRTFDSDSHQRIHFEIIDKEGLLASESFLPDSFSTINSYNDTTEAIWEFDISEITFDTITIALTFNIYHPPDHIFQLFPTLLVIVGIAGVIIISLVFNRRHQ